MTPEEALDAIRALCDAEEENNIERLRFLDVREIRAVLDRVEASPPPAIDRDATQWALLVECGVFDSREAAEAKMEHGGDEYVVPWPLAPGVRLTPEERALIVEALRAVNWEARAAHTRAWIENNFRPGPNGDRAIADDEAKEQNAETLAARLEAGQ